MSRFLPFPALAIALLLSHCSTVKKITPDMTTVKKILPGSSDQVSAEDPLIPFDARQPLQPGHTLRIKVHEDLRSGRELWEGLVVIEPDGTATVPKVGTGQAAGKTLAEATRNLAIHFPVSGRTSSSVIVHVLSVENEPLICVDGDTAQGTQYLPLTDNASVSGVVRYAGGRPAGSTRQSLHLIRNGKKTYYRNLEAANADWELKAGDIIRLSTTL